MEISGATAIPTDEGFLAIRITDDEAMDGKKNLYILPYGTISDVVFGDVYGPVHEAIPLEGVDGSAIKLTIRVKNRDLYLSVNGALKDVIPDYVFVTEGNTFEVLQYMRDCNLIDYISREYVLSSVTTSSILIAKFIKSNFEDIDVRASVNMEIGSVEGMSYVSDYFDSFYVRRELNRNLPMLLRLRKWCDENGKQMYLLANSGCLNNCSAHIFHDNLVAHEAEISAMDNGYQFRGVCWDFLSDENNFDIAFFEILFGFMNIVSKKFHNGFYLVFRTFPIFR
jgi:hypothetical protein